MSIASLVNTKGMSGSGIKAIGSKARMQRDPYAPNFELIVYGGRGAQPFAVGDEVKQLIEEITFEDNADQFDKLEIKMKAPSNARNADQINSIIDSRLFAEGHIIEVRMGYGNSLFTVGAADIVSIRPDFPDNDRPSVDIIGYDLLHRAGRRRPSGGVSYKGFRDSQIASIIGQRNGFDILLEDSRSYANIKKIPGVNDRIQNKGISDYAFLKKVAEINGFDLFSKFDPVRKKFGLFFQPPAVEKSKEVFVFAYNEGDLPYQETLLRFSPQLDAYDQATDIELFILQSSGSISYKPMDRLGFEEQKIIKDQQERRFTGGNLGGNDGAKPVTSDGIQVAFKAFGRSFTFPPHKRFINETQARKEIEKFIQRQKENFITGEGAVVGNEVLQSRQVHSLEGISKQFSGKYYMSKVVHKMGKDGYTTEFAARKVIVDKEVQAPPALNLTENDKRFKRVKKEKV